VRTSRRRIGAVLVAVAVLVAAGLALARLDNRPTPDLPRVTPASLIASTARALAQDRSISGSLQVSVDLGLPQVLDLGSQGGPLSLLSGTHELKLWRSADGVRISELETTGERAVFISHGHAWAWDFESLTAYDLGRLSPTTGSMFELLTGGGSEGAVRRGLAAISETTHVAVSGATSVAGRPAYELVFAPKQQGTLVGAVEVDVDAQTRLPLAISVFPRGRKDAAIALRFSSIGFDPIDPSVFDFTPPPGARVKRVGLEMADIDRLLALTHSFRTFGRGWTSVLAVRAPPVAQGAGGLVAGGFLKFQGSVVSVTVANRGDHSWVLIGTVPLARLEALEPRLS
jgi:hypothetical protein